MARFSNPLDNVRIASPCNADWDQMMGDERARFCGQCNLNVYNLSDMTRSEAELFIGRNEGRLCARYYRRSDGSILTKDCPVGLRAIRRRMSHFAKAVGSTLLTFLAGLGMSEFVSRRVMKLNPPLQREVMGMIAVNPKMPPVLQPAPIVGVENPVTMGRTVVVQSRRNKTSRGR